MKSSTSMERWFVFACAVWLIACSTEGTVSTVNTADAGRVGGENEFIDASICFEAGVQAERSTLPVDIIWVVDTSGSMSFESAAVESNLNAFAAQIDSWGIDYRVIMVAAQGGGSDVCVPEPLAGANCSDGASFRHVPLSVGSRNALGKLIEAYPMYQDFLRENSSKQFVVVSDDEANNDINDTWFRTAIAGLSNPGFPERESAPNGYVFHSIVAYGDVAGRGCDTGANIGQSYLNLTALTGGVMAKVCETDGQPIFAALQIAVVEGTSLPCTFDIPEPPDDKILDPNQLNVLYTRPGEAPVTIPRVNNAGECDQNGGWYYDDLANPTKIIMCEATCDAFNGDDEGEVSMQFGCTTVVL